MTIYEKLKATKYRLDQMNFSARDIEEALLKDSLKAEDFAALLSPSAKPYLEAMAQASQLKMKKHFGNAVTLFTPLYVSNYCDNHCLYCGFSSKQSIKRYQLTLEESEQEMIKIKENGFDEVLLLTGESSEHVSLEYIQLTVETAKKHFSTVGLEIMPLETEDYAKLQNCGADFVSVYQETYDEIFYSKVHLSGPKSDYMYRFNAQERALKGNMHGVSFGFLLGLNRDPFSDALSTGLHAYLIQKKFPYAEINFSVPRIRPFSNHQSTFGHGATEKDLVHIMLAYRLFMPFASITLSTRESQTLRDQAVSFVANKMSAEAKVTVGGHAVKEKSDEQFKISDQRSLNTLMNDLKKRNCQPVLSNHIHMRKG